MGFWLITYYCADGTTGKEIIPAVNKIAAWCEFEMIAKDYPSKVIDADCVLLLDN